MTINTLPNGKGRGLEIMDTTHSTIMAAGTKTEIDIIVLSENNHRRSRYNPF